LGLIGIGVGAWFLFGGDGEAVVDGASKAVTGGGSSIPVPPALPS